MRAGAALIRQLVEELMGPTCQCGRGKRPKQSFCKECFGMLPKEQQMALYRRIGNGYESAHAAAVSYLKAAGVCQ